MATGKQTAFVGGATGFTGREVVRQLAERGVDTHAHVRPDSARLEEWRGRFDAMGAKTDSTAWELGAMTATMARVRPTHVFALLGTTRARAKEAEARGERADYETVDYGMSVMLLDAAKAAGLAPRFIYLSAAAVGPSSRGEYLQVRHRVETLLVSSGVPWISARPSFIVGEDRDVDRPMERAAARTVDAALGALGALGAKRFRDRYRSTSNHTLARALVRLALEASNLDRAVESDELQRLGAAPPVGSTPRK